MTKYGKNNESVEVKGKGIGVGFGEVDSVSTEHKATFIISAEILDDDNEVLLIAGMDISKIKSGKRNVVWLDHIHNNEAALINDINKIGKTVVSDITFPERPEDLAFTENWIPDLAFAKAKVGFLKASIDFISLERRLPTKKDKEMFGEDIELVHSKTKLIGFSLTSLPANDETQLIAIKSLDKGKINEEEFNLLGIEYKKIEDEEVTEEAIEEAVVDAIENVDISKEVTPTEEFVEEIEVSEEVEEEEEVVVDKKVEVEKILKEIKQKRVKKPYIYVVETNPEIVRQQLRNELAKKLAKKTGKIFID